MELIAVVMGCDSSKNRNAACKALLDFGFANYALVEPQPEGTCEIPVVLGTEAAVRAVPRELPSLLIRKEQKTGITTEVQLEQSVEAPVSQGQPLGTMTVRSGEEVLATIPLVAQTQIPRLAWSRIWLDVMRRLLMGQ